MLLQRVQARRKGIKGYVNCMRPTCLSNPYRIGVDGDRSACCRQFRADLPRRYQSEAKLQAKINAIRQRIVAGETVKLGCSCRLDEECHVDSLIEFILSTDG